MANHDSSEKRIRQTATRRLRNRYYAKTARNAVRNLRKMTDKAAAEARYPEVSSYARPPGLQKHYLSKNKASNLKSKLAKHIAKLAA